MLHAWSDQIDAHVDCDVGGHGHPVVGFLAMEDCVAVGVAGHAEVGLPAGIHVQLYLGKDEAEDSDEMSQLEAMWKSTLATNCDPCR